jgi:hypothetical protein
MLIAIISILLVLLVLVYFFSKPKINHYPVNKMSSNINLLTTDEISSITEKYYTSGFIYQIDLEGLGRQFLIDALNLNPGESFVKVRNAYMVNTSANETEVPEDEFSFYLKIVNDFFQYDREPRSELTDIFFKASNHLKEIDARLAAIKSELEAINLAGIATEIQSKARVLDYYAKHNLSARENLVEFLRGSIYAYVLKKCNYLERREFDFYDVPYHYAWNPKMYDVRYPTMLANKFRYATNDTIQKLESMYEEDKPGFKEFIASYIDDQEIIFTIRSAMSNNHIIHKRADIIEESLNAYNDGKRAVFSSICAMLIEGIFHDICIEVGVPENKLLGAGFQEKLNFMQERLDLEFHYEYYSFTFRLLRNKIAHGLIDGSEAKEVADLFLLDLADAVHLATSMAMPMRQKLFFIDRASDLHEPFRYDYLTGYLFLKEVEIDPFYTMAEKESLLTVELKSSGFWNYTKALLDHSEPERRSLGQALLTILKSLRDPDLDVKCIAELRVLVKTGVPKLDKAEYIKKLIF